jgi:hypothetical protein
MPLVELRSSPSMLRSHLNRGSTGVGRLGITQCLIIRHRRASDDRKYGSHRILQSISAILRRISLHRFQKQRLPRRCGSVDEIIKSIDDYVSDPLMRGLHTVGAGAIACHPRYGSLQNKRFKSICHLCWAMQDITPKSDDDPVLSAAVSVGELGALS